MLHYITENDIVSLFQKYPPDDFGNNLSIENVDYIKKYLGGDENHLYSPRRKHWATVYANEFNLEHGATIRFFRKEYRNEGLYFWDAFNSEILEPFYDIDEYGSVPPRFVVGNGDFSPDSFDGVAHNSIVFPSISLMREIKQLYTDNKNSDTIKININGEIYTIRPGYEYYSNNNQLNVKTFDFNNFVLDHDQEEDDTKSLVLIPSKPEWRDDVDTKNRKLKGITRRRYKQSLLKNNTTKELKNIYEMAPPMPGMSMGGPLYQEGLEQWQKNIFQGGYKTKTKTKPKKKTRKSKHRY